jgi:hypothetical protein
MTPPLTLRRSTDRKTTTSASKNGKTANIANAFGLLSGRAYSCPGQTSVCESVCYAGKLENIFKGFAAVMAANWDAVKDATYSDLVISLSALIDDFERDCDKRGAVKAFRIHHDGDFFSRTYAAAWAHVVSIHPDVTFWAYTRSFVPGANVVDILSDIPNLTLYLSVDDANRVYADTILAEYPRTLIAYLSDTASEAGDAIKAMTGQNKPGAACPEVMGRIPLITDKGGACFACGLCIEGKANIRFAVKGR